MKNKNNVIRKSAKIAKQAICTILMTVLAASTFSCKTGGPDNPSGQPGTTRRPDGTDPASQAEDPARNVFPEGENIQIGIFWEPPAEFTTPEQYDWIRDAHITHIEITNRNGAVSKEVSDLQLKLAGERGIKVYYSTGVDGKKLKNMSPAQITEYVQTLKQNPTIEGIHVVDEPADPWNYAKVLAAITEGGLTPRLNMLPYFATWVFENYQGFVEDTLAAAGPGNYGYLCYDQYPFPYNGGDPDMFYNLDLFRQIGLKYDVPTAFYIQSIGEGGNFRRTNGGEIRYHTSAGLAYGLKSMTYFTWWTTGYCDPKDYAIISPYGEKTSIYDDVAEIDADILKVGTLLRRLDALEVYHTSGSENAIVHCNQDDVPLYAEPQGRYGLIISLMEDRETGRDYVMLVNKDYTSEVTYELSISDKFTYLYNCTGGTYDPVDISSGKVTVNFKPGGFALFAAGQHDTLVEKVEDISANKAQGKAVYTGDVNPGSGYYAYCITDGIRNDKVNLAQGYRSTKNRGELIIDLGRATPVSRIDIYPAGSNYTRGETFPQAFTLELSADGQNWTAVVEKSSYTDAKKGIPSFTFDKTDARYVKLAVTAGSEAGGFEIGEIEVYGDSGDAPAPDNAAFYTDPTQIKEGSNLAKGKSVKVSSDLGGDWSKNHITDGNRRTCWSSALNRHPTEDGVEWALIDLGAELEFNEVDVYPRGDGEHFPFNFRIEISNDGKTFTNVFECSVDEKPTDGQASICVLENTCAARYVRIYGYRLRDQKGFNDGHLFQMAEVEIYKK